MKIKHFLINLSPPGKANDPWVILPSIKAADRWSCRQVGWPHCPHKPYETSSVRFLCSRATSSRNGTISACLAPSRKVRKKSFTLITETEKLFLISLCNYMVSISIRQSFLLFINAAFRAIYHCPGILPCMSLSILVFAIQIDLMQVAVIRFISTIFRSGYLIWHGCRSWQGRSRHHKSCQRQANPFHCFPFHLSILPFAFILY